MANTQRNDPSSLSFGRRLRQVENEAAVARRTAEDLAQKLPASGDLQAAAVAGEAIKASRKAAKQTIARPDATLAELSAIDSSVLTPMYQEQLRHAKIDAGYREQLASAQPLQITDPGAIQRIQNWQASARAAGITPIQQQDFEQMNFAPAQASNFERWNKRQQSFDGRKWATLQSRAELDRDLQQARAKRAAKPKAQGRHIGGIKPIESEQ